MAHSRRRFFSCSLKRLVWILLPLMGVSIWILTAWITAWVLGHSLLSTRQLQTNLYPTTQLTRTLIITAIHARIDRNDNLAEVTLTTPSTLTRLEFKFPLSQITDLETALAALLNTSADAIHPLIHYRID